MKSKLSRSGAAEIKWSEQQLQAISARGGTVLVSAAAGSGKTAVLVERVIRLLEDEEFPCEPSELLIVTFTRAAAAQLRQKLSSKLAERARLNPHRLDLRRKLLLLPSAQISTIDSLCSRLVKENFSSCKLPPDFRLLDDAQSNALEAETMEELLHQAYEKSSPNFLGLTALFSDSHGDNKLESIILNLYNKARANPNPKAWLRGLLSPYNETLPLRDSVWGRLIIREADEALDSLLTLHSEALQSFEEEPEVNDAFTAAYISDIAMLNRLKNALKEDSWDELCAAFSALKFDSRNKKPKDYDESALFKKASLRRDKCKNTLKKLNKTLFFLNEETAHGDAERLLPLAKELISLVLLFGDRFSSKKRERGAADFGDVQHFALQLLVNDDGEKTALARALSEQYAEILVDEYQDVNHVQESLFHALSRKESNLFFVGDVKQSIYRFRQAEPEIFLKRREALAPYSNAKSGGKIILGRNYRSLSGITGCANHIFAHLMQRRAGELDYTQDEYLIPNRVSENTGAPDVIFRLLRTLNGQKRDLQQARYCAKLIDELLSSERMIEDGGRQRPLEPGDITILMRSPKKKAAEYAAALARRGIECRTELSGGFFKSNEIRLALSLLQIIDNPVQDVPLLATLLSPLFGFSEDELAELCGFKKSDGGLYQKLLAAAEENPRCAEFLRTLGQWRNLSLALPCELFLHRLFDESGLWSIVLAMKNGARRQSNLKKLEDLASQSKESGRPGLSGLLRFLEAVRERGQDMECAPLPQGSDSAVRIMSIHKSKGLEFPVCIIADIGKTFNAEDGKKAAVISPHAGLGLKLREGDAFGIYPTIPHTAARLEAAELNRAEELRLLYVAVTRAKDLLIFIGAPPNINTAPESMLESASALLTSSERFPPYAVRSANSYLDWLLPVFIQKSKDSNQSFNLDFGIAELPAEEEIRKAEFDFPCADEILSNKIWERMSWIYPTTAPEGMPAKQTASSFARSDYPENIALSVPNFLESDNKSAARRGTLLHWVLERLDFKEALHDFSAALKKITRDGGLDANDLTLSEKQMLERFIKSDIVRRFVSSPYSRRERQFTARLAVCELYPEHKECTEKITVIGAADCVFEESGELVIVDYKTDRASPEELLRRYSEQLRVYAKALTLCEGKPVREAMIYSLRHGIAISL